MNNKALPVRYVNILHPSAKKIKAAQESELTVVNAPRPISGHDAWEGEFMVGRFYACGDLQKWEKHWLAYGASRLVLVTNQEVLQTIIEESKDHRFRFSLRGILERRGPGGVKEFAAAINMPYRVDDSSDFLAELEAADWSRLQEANS